jgi:hypothetical protein
LPAVVFFSLVSTSINPVWDIITGGLALIIYLSAYMIAMIKVGQMRHFGWLAAFAVAFGEPLGLVVLIAYIIAGPVLPRTPRARVSSVSNLTHFKVCPSYGATRPPLDGFCGVCGEVLP